MVSHHEITQKVKHFTSAQAGFSFDTLQIMKTSDNDEMLYGLKITMIVNTENEEKF